MCHRESDHIHNINSSNTDWYYTGSSSTDNTRWQSEKTIYDPCPAGWRVPDGGEDGIWSKALGSSSFNTGTYDSTNNGMNFSGKFSDASTIWYPASGCRYVDGSFNNVGDCGYYWSASPNSYGAYYLYFYGIGRVGPSHSASFPELSVCDDFIWFLQQILGLRSPVEPGMTVENQVRDDCGKEPE